MVRKVQHTHTHSALEKVQWMHFYMFQAGLWLLPLMTTTMVCQTTHTHTHTLSHMHTRMAIYATHHMKVLPRRNAVFLLFLFPTAD